MTLDELTVADRGEAWRDCGFEVSGDVCVLGRTRIRFVPDDGKRGLTGWALAGLRGGSGEADGAEPVDLDGLPTALSEGLARPEEQPAHPNGVTSVDHVVVISSNLDRTVAALDAAGLDLRRIREEPTPAGAPRQAFFRLGEVILEVVQEPREATERASGDRAAFFWGLALATPDIETSAAFFGDRLSEVRPAVQPGRQIATLRRSAGLSLPLALITPPPP